jgi:hypothetical protein
MFKFRKYNATNRFEFSIENFVTKMYGTSDYVSEAMRTCKVDYANNTITFSVADLEGGTTERFFDQLNEDPELLVRLRMYRRTAADAGPTVDYTKRFHGARIESRSISLSFEVSEAATHDVVMSFKTSELESFLAPDDQQKH